ncbi:MAG: hypothetical protein BGO11_08695 [Solirubrobacterales bacterium 70-9]|nr:MAG: hypothetical protein BGO11_08695 [Solirubrobacterales bacterium 70-9]
MRWGELRRLLSGWKFLVPTGVVSLGFFIYGLQYGVAVALILPLLVIGIALWVTWMLAGDRAQRSFLEVYAHNRGLKLETVVIPEKATPLLREGVGRGTSWTMAGELAPGIDGTLAVFYYEEPTIDSDGMPTTKNVYFTIGLVELPECSPFVPELYCKRKFGLRSLEKFEDAFRVGKKRVTLESEALAERYEIFAKENQNDVWLRRLFSPSFIVWLTESPPEKFAFELVDGTLVAFIPDRREDIVSLDAVLAATGAVATRLRDESSQSGISSAPARAR